MRFLFVVDSVENPAAANPRLARVLGAALAVRGAVVHYLELWDGRAETRPPAAATSHPLPFADERLMNEALENGAQNGSALPLRLARLAGHPTAVAAAFRQLVLHRPRRQTACQSALERLDAEFHFDAIVAVCAPYRSAFALQAAQVGAKKIVWQLDPYAANRDYKAPGGYAREAALLQSLYAAFITPQALADYAPGAPLEKYRDKVHVLGFPCLVPPAQGAEAAPAAKKRRQCVFCGSLYPRLRTPDAALSLFAGLNPPGWQLVMAGGGWQPFAPARQRAAAVLGDRLLTPGPIPPAQARALMDGADVLLSLGNAVDNQMPSKLFEYFGTGKPVLHLALSENDPTLPYLRRYPLALVLGPQMRPGDAETLRTWLDKTAGQQVPFETVAALYKEFTPAQVAEDFLKIF